MNKRVLILSPGEKPEPYAEACSIVGIDSVTSDNYVDPLGFDGLLVAGGPDVDPSLYGQENRGSLDFCRNTDEMELSVIDAFIAAGKPVFGTCRGSQIINVYFGGTLKQHIEGHSIRHNGMHPVRILGESKFAAGLSELTEVNSTHHQCVDELGKDLVLLAKSADGIGEAYYHKSQKLFAVQWHPENIMAKGGQAVYEIFRDMLD